ncbi:MAG: secA translation cis-regulator SecM [Candidatus Malihini olakiniferum]
MSILDRWRQFGRRYFWPRILLGMVEVSLGLPISLNESNEHASASNVTASISPKNHVNFSLTEPAILPEVHRYTSFGIDYWNYHTIRTVIRYFSFALPLSQANALPQVEAALSAHPLVMLDTFNALFTLPKTPSSALHSLPRSNLTRSPHITGLWLSQVHGIRAGPALSA